MSAHPAKIAGPLDDHAWPEKLKARVITPGHRPRLHGYDCEGDLAPQCSFAQTVVLSLTGELPAAAAVRAFDIALQFAAPVSVAEAPTHAAVLARVCAGSTSSIAGTAVIGLAERARAMVERLGPWVHALTYDGPLPACAAPIDDEDRASMQRLRTALQSAQVDISSLRHDVGRDAGVLAVLHHCGLTSPETLEVALVLASFPLSMAEALATPPVSHTDYPVDLPPIRYVEPS